LRVAEGLVKAKSWTAARHTLRRALALQADPELVTLLLQASAQVQDPAERAADLELAVTLAAGTPPVLWAQAQAAREQGHGRKAAELAVRALRGFLQEGLSPEAEDALLVALENPSVPSAQALIALLPVMMERQAPQLAEAALDLLGPVVEQFHLSPTLLKTLEKMMGRANAAPGLRARYLEAVIQARGDREAVMAAATETNFLSSEAPLEKTLAAFGRALRFAPGALVKHLRWGVGRITSANDVALTIDFPGTPGHSMARSMAARSLTSLAGNSLEAQIALHLEDLQREAKADPAALLVRVIDEAGGEASAAQIKKWLAGSIIGDQQWSGWWKEARQAATRDPRIDHTQAFAGHYRRSTGEAATESFELPPLKRQEGLAASVKMIRDLLRQHPDAEEEAKQRYGVVLDDWAQSDEPLEPRALAALLLTAWHPQERARWAEWIARQVVDSQSLNFLTTAPDQRTAVEVAMETPYASSILVVALGSRFGEIRDLARERVAALGEEAPALLYTWLRDPQAPTPIQTQVAELMLELPDPWSPERSPWAVFLALARALGQAKAQRDVTAIGALLTAGSTLSGLLRGLEPPPEVAMALEGALLDLRRQVKRAATVKSFLHATGHDELAAYLEQPKVEKPVHLAPELDESIFLMTHQTYEEKVLRRDLLQHELATVIPELIAKARALGDLSENADYHAARERQGLAAAEVRALEAVIERSRLIEKQDMDEDMASAGTEVGLKDLATGHERIVWILGLDDGYHGEEVINYRAGLGQALIGHRVGDEVTVEVDGQEVTYRLMTVQRRMPDVLAELDRFRAHRGGFND